MQERKEFGLVGRLPFEVNTLDQQCRRAYDQFNAMDTPIRQNQFLQSLKDQNWVLYYSLISRYLREMIPIIYTPTEVSFRARRSDRQVLISYRPRLSPTTRISFVGTKVSISPILIRTLWRKISWRRPRAAKSNSSSVLIRRLYLGSVIRVSV
jgi:hypothetical protein